MSEIPSEYYTSTRVTLDTNIPQTHTIPRNIQNEIQNELHNSSKNKKLKEGDILELPNVAFCIRNNSFEPFLLN